MVRFSVMVLCLAGLLSAHFEILIPKEEFLEGKETSVVNVFGHPFESDYLMAGGTEKNGEQHGLQEAFFVHRGERNDLTSGLQEQEFVMGASQEVGYRMNFTTQRMGDYAVFVVPHPYWESAENVYIQQIAKILLNKGGMSTDWHRRCAPGYTEIVPLVNPYRVGPGMVFRAQVLDSEGNPASEKIVEVEYLNADLDWEEGELTHSGALSREHRGTNTVVTDELGIFTFTPPEAGFWGFSALNAGNDTEFDGEELEQSPVIWVSVK